MKLPKTLIDTPTFDKPFVLEPPLQMFHQSKPPLFVEVVSDSDSDGVIDPWDCQPFNPDEDGIFGDLYQKAKAFVKPDYGRAAARRAAVGRRISSGVSRGVSAARGGIRAAIHRAPIHVSRRRAAERRANIAGRVKDIRKRLTTSRLPVRDGRVQPFKAYSHEAAAGRRQKIAGTLERIGAKVGVDFERAAERRAAVRDAGIIGAPKQMLTGISEMGKPVQARVGINIGDVIARQHAKLPGGKSYGLSLELYTKGFYEKAAQVATVARRFEREDQVAYVPDILQKIGAPEQFTVPSVESLMQRTEKRLGLHSEWIPEPIRAAGGAAKEFGYGAAFSGTAGAVELAGMVPVGFEIMARRPSIIPAAIAVGAVKMGEGMWHGATTSPFRMAGEFTTFGALMKGGGRVIDPLTPKIIRGEGYIGVGIKGRTKPAYETIDVPATPKEFLKSEMLAGRIKGGIQRKPFTEYPAGKKPFGTARIDVGELAAMTKPTEIFVAPKTYGYSAMRKIADPLMKLTKMDIYQQRRFKADYPTHQEVLAHELIHHKSPKFSEGKVQKLTRQFAESPSKKIFTIPKQVKVGYTYTPKPIIGLRTAKFTTPSGVATTYKGIQIGKSWMPAEITRTYERGLTHGAEGITELSMERSTHARLGQLRYERTGFARGEIAPEVSQSTAMTIRKTPTQGFSELMTGERGFPELMTGERGLMVVDALKPPPVTPKSTALTVTGRSLPSVDVLKPPKPLKPTRVYAEVKQPYAKAVDMPLAGSPARMRWIEAGFRKVSYGVKGGPKQPKIEIAAEPWGYHPTYPTGIAGGTAAVPSYLTGYAPKRITTGTYFHPEGAPSSRVTTIEDILRPKTTGIRPPKVSAKPARPKPVRPRAEPITTPAKPIAPEPARPRPTIREAEPLLAPEPAPITPKRRVTFAEPETSPVLEAMLKDTNAAKAEVLQTDMSSCPIFAPSRARPRTATEILAQTRTPVDAPSPTAVPARPRTATEILAQTRAPVDAFIPKPERTTTTRRKPKPTYAGIVEPRTPPLGVPSFTPAPEESDEDKRRRRWFGLPTPDPFTKPVPDRHLEPYPDPTPDPYIEPEPQPDPEPEPTPTPRPGEWAPPPPPPGKTKITEPPPPPPIIRKSLKDKKKPRKRKTPGKRKPFEWFVKHDLITLESFMGSAVKAPPSGTFPEPDLGTPKI